MKIAQVVPLMSTIPPEKYGGIERIVTWLTNDLLDQGHEVTLFAARGSSLHHKNLTLVTCSPYPTFDHMMENRRWEIEQFKKVIVMQKLFDIIHFHYEPYILKTQKDGVDINLAQDLYKPTIFTIHNNTYISERIAYYKKMPKTTNVHFVFISENQRKPLFFLPNTHIIYNGIPVDTFSYNDLPKDYLFFLGRFTPVKGVKDAILTGIRTDRKLLLAARVDEEDKQFYENEIAPNLSKELIVNLGEIDKVDKINYLKNAFAVLFPIHWEEPFGLVIIEAMACGTPVIAYDRGSVAEIVKDGETGFIVNESEESIRGNWLTKTTGIAGLCKALERLYSLTPTEYKKMRFQARKRVERYFQSAIMSEKYLDLYENIVK